MSSLSGRFRAKRKPITEMQHIRSWIWASRITVQAKPGAFAFLDTRTGMRSLAANHKTFYQKSQLSPGIAHNDSA